MLYAQWNGIRICWSIGIIFAMLGEFRQRFHRAYTKNHDHVVKQKQWIYCDIVWGLLASKPQGSVTVVSSHCFLGKKTPMKTKEVSLLSYCNFNGIDFIAIERWYVAAKSLQIKGGQILKLWNTRDSMLLSNVSCCFRSVRTSWSQVLGLFRMR